jgi:hypothetical protein
MTEYDNTDKGSIWKNEKKETDRHPDFTGSANVGGHDYWVSAWRRKDGDSPKSPALRFSFKLKDGQPRTAPKKSLRDEMDGEEIPF